MLRQLYPLAETNMTDDILTIGQLIAFGLDPRLSPGRNGAYQELVTRFRGDAEFRQRVASLAAGQGLEILDCSPVYGLVLAATGPDSPYYMRLDDYAAMSAAERHLNAFIFLAIAATCYPTADALDAEDGPLPQITVTQVLRLMNRMADRIRERCRDEDPPADEPQSEPLYRLVLRWREGDTTADERSNPHVKAGMVRRALKWLAANGLADEIGTSKDAFRIRSRFRLHVKDAVASIGPALAHVRDLAVDAAQ
jgi:hypothetical protein